MTMNQQALTKYSSNFRLEGRDTYRVFFSFAFAYFISYSFRSINAVISPELIADLGLNNAQLGLLSAAYFIGFGLAQIPAGVCLDRFGPRLTEISLMIFSVIGALFFYFSKDFYNLLLGRMLIGVGVSACLMSAFSGFRAWYPLEKQAQLTSAILIFGTSGALMTSSPARILLPYIGWRGIFFVLALATILAITILYKGLPKSNAKGLNLNIESSKKDVRLFSWTEYGPIVKNSYFLRLFPIGAINLGGFIAIQTLWLGPWLINVMGHTSDEASKIIFWFNAFLLLAYAVNAILLPTLQKKGITTLLYLSWMTGISLIFQLLAFFTYSSWSHYWWYLYAITSASYVLAQSLVVTNFPASHSGRVSTTYNITIFIGAFIIQWGIGSIVDVGSNSGLSTKYSFSIALGIYLIIQLVGYIWFLISPRIFTSHKYL
jgi:MFS family permease